MKKKKKIKKKKKKIDVDVFTGKCKIPDHLNAPLSLFCTKHNKLCCGLCICPRNTNNYGQHNNCKTVDLKDIEEEKKTSLKNNINMLDDLSIKFEDSYKRLEEIKKLIFENKNNLKEEIRKTFDIMKKELVKKEYELIKEVDKKYEKIFFDESNLKKFELLRTQIKANVVKAKSIDQNWNKANLPEMINTCLIVENNIKTIKSFIDKVDNTKDEDIKFDLLSKDSCDKLIESIQTLKTNELSNFFTFFECPKNIIKERIYEIIGKRRNKVKKISNDAWQTIKCINILPLNEEITWTVRINKSKNNYIMAGICPLEIDLNTARFDNCGWNYYFYDSTIYLGPEKNFKNEKTNIPKCIEIQIKLNTKVGKLIFSDGNPDNDYLIDDIPLDKPLVPCICLYNTDDEAEIKNIE